MGWALSPSEAHDATVRPGGRGNKIKAFLETGMFCSVLTAVRSNLLTDARGLVKKMADWPMAESLTLQHPGSTPKFPPCTAR